MVRILSAGLEMIWYSSVVPGVGCGGSGFRVQGSGFRVWGSRFRVQDSGFRI
jgi:hypothetical protein